MSRYFIIFLLLSPSITFAQSGIATGGFEIIDSLKQQHIQATNLLDKVELSAQIAEIYSTSRQFPDSSIHYRNYAYQALNQTKERESKEEGYTRIIEAIILEMNLDSFSKQALTYIESPQRKARIYLVLGGGYYFSKENYDKNWCLAVMDTVKHYIDQTPDDELYVKYYNSCVYCYLLNSELLPSLEKLLKAEAILKEDYQGAAEVYDNLAYVYRGLQAYNKALSTAKKGRKLAQKRNDYFNEAAAISSIMTAALSLKKYDLVQSYADTFLLLEQKKSGNGVIRAHRFLGEIALAKGNTSLAKTHFRRALASDGPRTDLSVAQIHQGLSKVSYLENDLDLAKVHADSAVMIFDWENVPELAGRFREFAKVYAARKEYRTAYEFIAKDLKEVTIKDSLNNPYDIISTLLNENFEQEKTILSTQIKQRNQLLWFLLAVALGVIGSAIIFYRNSLVRKRLAEKVQAQNKAILVAQDQLITQEKLASLGQLTAGIAHEIKNPLNFINNFAEGSVEMHEELITLLDTNKADIKDDLLKEIKTYLVELSLNAEDIKEKGLRVDKIVRSMMEHSRGEDQSQTTIDLNVLIRETTNLSYHGFRSLEPTFKVHYQYNLLSDLPKIKIFEQEISRVLLNLFNNASFAIFEKQQKKLPNFKPTIQIDTSATDHQITLTIKDNGIGIPEKFLGKIFNPFFTTKPANGINTGLGLSISHDIIVEKHQGQIEVESQVNEFTQFRIHLPIQGISGQTNNII